MELARLVYECVRGTHLIPENREFAYDSFVNGQYDDDPNWSTEIANVWSALNLAISRLSDSDKIPFKTSDPILVQEGCLIELPEDCDDVVSVWCPKKDVTGDYAVIPFRYFGEDKLALDLPVEAIRKLSVYVEYRRAIPHFDRSSIRSVVPETNDPNQVGFDDNSKEGSFIDEEGSYVDPNAELDLKKEYGISDKACDYIRLYVRAELTRSMDFYMSSQDRNLAEQYFQALRTYRPGHYQYAIENRTFGRLF